MKRSTILIVILFLSTLITQAQAPTIQWQKCFGGSNDENAFSIIQTTDGGYIVAGFSNSNDGDVSVNKGNNDYWIVKLNAIGDTIWTKSLGGSDYDRATSINQTNDGGYVIAGSSNSNDGDVNGNQGDYDYWIIKLNTIGDSVWTKCLGGSSDDGANSIIQTNDDGYIVAGYSFSTDGDVSGNHGYEDLWIVKLNTIGDTLWTKSFGGSSHESANSIIQTNGGGYIVSGSSYSTDGDISENHGYSDYWIITLNAIGDTVWTKCLGGSSDDFSESINQTSDGGSVIAGFSNSMDGDVSNNHGNIDYWIVKLNETGDTLWTKSLGGLNYDRATSVTQISDGGYIVVGSSESTNGDVSGNHGSHDYWIIKLNSIGDTLWTKSLGGTGNDGANSIIQTIDGGYIIAGYSESTDGDVSGNHGGSDYWIVKLSPDTLTSVVELNKKDLFTIYPNPTTGNLQLTVNKEHFKNARIEITDIKGKIVKQITLEEFKSLTIDLSNQAKGIYFVKLIGDGFVSTQKVVLE